MFTLMIVLFLIGYTVIALEHPLKINKTATALLLGVVLWVCAVCGGQGILVDTSALRDFQMSNPGSTFTDWLVHSQLIHALGDIAEILFFLMGAMTIVELIDTEGGFRIITDRISTTSKVKLLWVTSILAFFMSAVLDNLTTSIVMVALLRKLIGDRHDRWFFASMVIVAANAGGAWSPIGDVTTIMLWIAGDVSAGNIIVMTFLPSLVCLLVPLIILSFILKGEVGRPEQEQHHIDAAYANQKPWASYLFLIVGVGALVFVPVFKTITHLPPYVGMLGGLSILWMLSEIIHRNDEGAEKSQYSIFAVISRIDLPSILFFLGILLAVNALATIGHLHLLSTKLDTIPLQEPGKYYVINLIIGVLSSIVDNVPLVAGAMGMYNFPIDHYFWEFLAYCAGTGGSILIIGSAAGVAVMGLEKIDFIWYLKHISWIALVGYFCGAGFFIGQKAVLNHFNHEAEQSAAVVMTEDGVTDYLHSHTFCVTNADITQDLADSVVINFIRYEENDVTMYGMNAENHLTNFDRDSVLMFSRNKTLIKSDIEVEIEDTVAYVFYADQQMAVTKSGKVFLITQSGLTELRKIK
ncbi:MAG: sodium:proton antiporter NhaD [Bacteroidales bacterium]|nr:sodium:proton antiporter NhaD [Bacteroidales bacterium]